MTSSSRSGGGKWQTVGRRDRASVDVLPVPEFEDDERPEPERMLTSSGHVLVDDARDERRVEVAALSCAAGQKDVGKQLAYAAAEPAAERYFEAAFAPVQDVARQQRRRRLLQDVLPPAVTDLQVGRQLRGKVDDLVVEERHARFDRMRHAHA